MNIKHLGMVFTCLMAGILWFDSAQAVPAFARKYDRQCSSCHTAYPQLNQTGREFKEAGYKFESDAENSQTISDFLYLDDRFPISGVLVARPYDKKDSGDKKIRAIHEVELIAAGTLAQNWSGWFEIEAEDETNFDPELKNGIVSFNYNKAFNLQFIYGPTFWADPYGFLGDHFRLTRGHVGFIDQTYGGADAGGRLRSSRQNVGIYGRPTEKLFYNVVFSGKASDAEGEDASTYSGRLAFDITNRIMIGGFAINGQDQATNLDFTRAGLDTSIDFGTGGRLQAAFTSASDDVVGGGNVDNNAWSVQGMWVFTDDSLRPTWVPLIRYDYYEKNDGQDEYGELTVNIGYYINENIKVFAEYFDRTDTPTGVPGDSRFTIQLTASF